MPHTNTGRNIPSPHKSRAGLLLILLGLLMPSVTTAASTIDSASALNQLCQKRSIEHFQRRGQTARNWHSKTVRRGNDYVTSAELRVDGETVGITCRAPVGAGKRSLRWQLARDQ